MSRPHKSGQSGRRTGLVPAVFAIALLVFAGCSDSDGLLDPPEDLTPEQELTRFIRANYPLETMPTEIPYPPDNPPDEDVIALGRQLFFDPVLSGDGDVSCATCHHPALAWADGIPVSIGVGGVGIGPERVQTMPITTTEFTTPRNSLTILNVGLHKPFEGEPPHRGRIFWDGRANGLEEQARLPVRNRDEMRHDAYTAPEALTRVIENLQAIDEYVEIFAAAFPAVADQIANIFGPDFSHLVVNGDTYSRSLAAYMRELVTGDSRYDLFARGDDSALTYAEKRGLDVFNRIGCVDCHSGAMFTDSEFHALGVLQGGSGSPPIHEFGDGSDLGRYLDSGQAEDRYRFRTPSLRNVDLTAPYFHTGGEGSGGDYQTLRSVIEFHRDGGNDEGLPAEVLDPLLRPIEMTEEEVDDLIAFLKSLTALRLASDRVDPTVPETVPSGLEPVPVMPPVLTNDYGREE